MTHSHEAERLSWPRSKAYPARHQAGVHGRWADRLTGLPPCLALRELLEQVDELVGLLDAEPGDQAHQLTHGLGADLAQQQVQAADRLAHAHLDGTPVVSTKQLHSDGYSCTKPRPAAAGASSSRAR